MTGFAKNPPRFARNAAGSGRCDDIRQKMPGATVQEVQVIFLLRYYMSLSARLFTHIAPSPSAPPFDALLATIII